MIKTILIMLILCCISVYTDKSSNTVFRIFSLLCTSFVGVLTTNIFGILDTKGQGKKRGTYLNSNIKTLILDYLFLICIELKLMENICLLKEID